MSEAKVKCVQCGRKTGHPYNGPVPAIMSASGKRIPVDGPLCSDCWHLVLDSAGLLKWMTQATPEQAEKFADDCCWAMCGPNPTGWTPKPQKTRNKPYGYNT
jgi:hypothetical protein